MDTLIRIVAQYFENYSDDLNSAPYWKQKGTVEFNLTADLDDIMYEKDMAVKAIKDLLLEQSNPHFKYEYVDMVPVFHLPITLDSEKFKFKLADLCKSGQ